MKFFSTYQDTFEAMHDKSSKKIVVEQEKNQKKMIAFAFKAFKSDEGGLNDIEWNPQDETVFDLQAQLGPLFQTQRKSFILLLIRKLFQAGVTVTVLAPLITQKVPSATCPRSEVLQFYQSAKLVSKCKAALEGFLQVGLRNRPGSHGGIGPPRIRGWFPK